MAAENLRDLTRDVATYTEHFGALPSSSTRPISPVSDAIPDPTQSPTSLDFSLPLEEQEMTTASGERSGRRAQVELPRLRNRASDFLLASHNQVSLIDSPLSAEECLKGLDELKTFWCGKNPTFDRLVMSFIKQTGGSTILSRLSSRMLNVDAFITLSSLIPKLRSFRFSTSSSASGTTASSPGSSMTCFGSNSATNTLLHICWGQTSSNFSPPRALTFGAISAVQAEPPAPNSPWRVPRARSIMGYIRLKTEKRQQQEKTMRRESLLREDRLIFGPFPSLSSATPRSPPLSLIMTPIRPSPSFPMPPRAWTPILPLDVHFSTSALDSLWADDALGLMRPRLSKTRGA
ncbi:hypothetical protein FB451DRAFT_1556615 [Mycena latifolia]|nr:hypothetical protein FB451DRAFT_1556615 [Mycena latifolia]